MHARFNCEDNQFANNFDKSNSDSLGIEDLCKQVNPWHQILDVGKGIVFQGKGKAYK